MKEQVLVFPTVLLKELNFEFNGFRKFNDDNNLVDNLLSSNKLFYMDRDKAEEDPTHLQLIPYCMVIHKDKIFSYKRTKKGGEKRLHELYSIGIGGHISLEDSNEAACNFYSKGLFRELKEEIDLKGYYHIDFYGFIRDTTTPVNSVHFGVVHKIVVHDKEPKWNISDKALSNGGFETVETLKKNIDSFESWSKMIIETL